MQRTSHEILSLAAYLPFDVLPEGVKQDIFAEIRRGLLKDFNFCDDNTELYFLKSEGANYDYIVSVSTVFDEDEPPEMEFVELGGLPENERSELDSLIIQRMQYALQHVNEI